MWLWLCQNSSYTSQKENYSSGIGEISDRIQDNPSLQTSQVSSLLREHQPGTL